MTEETPERNFAITDGKGFQIKLPNGWIISVQFGQYNYCQNKDMVQKSESGVYCANAEIAILGDEVEEPQGWQSPEDFIRILNETAARPKFVPSEV